MKILTCFSFLFFLVFRNEIITVKTTEENLFERNILENLIKTDRNKDNNLNRYKLDLDSMVSMNTNKEILEEKEDENEEEIESLKKISNKIQDILKSSNNNMIKSNNLKYMENKNIKADYKFGEPLPIIRKEDLKLYENASKELILSVAIPIMKPEEQFNTIRRICHSHYKTLPKSHRYERTNVNWCKIIASKDPKIMIKVNNMYKMTQIDLISVLGGIGPGGSVSSQGISGTRIGIGWTQQNICEGFFLLETYRGIGDCERIFLDLLARYHGQWGLFFKMFRQKFRDICGSIGYSKGLWDVSNDRAYSAHTVLRSSKKPINIKLSKERREYINYLRNRGGICSLLTTQQKEKAKILKHAVDNISQIKHISRRMCLLDYCDILFAKRTNLECVEGIITFFKLKSETYFNSANGYLSIKPLLLKACSEALFQEKEFNKLENK